MGLRGRLTLFFVAITVIPLAVAMVVLRVQIDRQLQQRASAEVVSVRDAAVNLISARRARAGDVATDMVLSNVGPVLAARDSAAARVWLEQHFTVRFADRADFVVLVGPDGALLASRVIEEAEAFDAAAVAAAVAGNTAPSTALTEVREVRGNGENQTERLLGWVAAGVHLDGSLLERLSLNDGLAVIVDGRVLAARTQDEDPVPIAAVPPDGEVRDVGIDGERLLVTAMSLDGVAGSGPATPRLLVWANPGSDSPAISIALFVLLPSTIAAALFGLLLASAIAVPIRRAAAVARAVAGGDLTQSLLPTGGTELADLAVSLNTMTTELATRLEELGRSRDQLRQSLSRLGQTLVSSLDLNATLAVVVETAIDTFVADRGVLMLFTPERDALYVKVGRNVAQHLPTLRADEGLAGHVVRTGQALRLPADRDSAPPPAEGELTGRQQIIAPLLGRGRVMGVLSLTRDADEPAFSADDLDAMQTFAGQASGAIENVMLHHEARRLSVTDGLTGLWNLRYLQLQAERELESSERFERPMSMLIIDLDHFKQVNDTYGHQVGDDVLIEVAARLRDATRVPDVVARYGGEEFVVLLPGTDSQGAAITAERIRDAVASVPISSSAAGGAEVQQLNVTCSIGVATYPGDGATVAALLRNADAAMYLAKTGGRNRVVIAAGDTAPARKPRARKTK